MGVISLNICFFDFSNDIQEKSSKINSTDPVLKMFPIDFVCAFHLNVSRKMKMVLFLISAFCDISMLLLT